MDLVLTLGLRLGVLPHQSGSIREATVTHALNDAAYFVTRIR
jgi:hypothetical protein